MESNSFYSHFYGQAPQNELSTLLVNGSSIGDKVWPFLALVDVLHLSVCSKAAAQLLISNKLIERFFEENPRISHLGAFKLSLSTSVSCGILRRILHRLTAGSEGVIYIDEHSGRVVMDLGSAFQDADAYLASAVTLCAADDSFPSIEKKFEIASFDEYDDFAPRHPNPREKTHRRGDSYFNSDIEAAASEALTGSSFPGFDNMGFDMSNIASLALGMENLKPMSAAAGPPNDILSPGSGAVYRRRGHRKSGSGNSLPLSFADDTADALASKAALSMLQAEGDLLSS